MFIFTAANIISFITPLLLRHLLYFLFMFCTFHMLLVKFCCCKALLANCTVIVVSVFIDLVIMQIIIVNQHGESFHVTILASFQLLYHFGMLFIIVQQIKCTTISQITLLLTFFLLSQLILCGLLSNFLLCLTSTSNSLFFLFFSLFSFSCLLSLSKLLCRFYTWITTMHKVD